MIDDLPDDLSRNLQEAARIYLGAERFNDDLWMAVRFVAEKRMASALIVYDRLYAETRQDSIRFKRLRCYLPLNRAGDFDREAEALTKGYGAAGASAAVSAALDFGDLDRSLIWLARMKDDSGAAKAPPDHRETTRVSPGGSRTGGSSNCCAGSAGRTTPGGGQTHPCESSSEESRG